MHATHYSLSISNSNTAREGGRDQSGCGQGYTATVCTVQSRYTPRKTFSYPVNFSLRISHSHKQKSSELMLQVKVLAHPCWELLTLDHSPTTSWGGQSTFAHGLLVGNLGSWQVSSECFRKLPSVNSCLQYTLRVWMPPPQVREH